MRPTGECSKCRSPSSVINSRPIGDNIVRRRECPRCGTRWNTVEIREERFAALLRLSKAVEALMVEAKDGGKRE